MNTNKNSGKERGRERKAFNGLNCEKTDIFEAKN